MIPPILSAFAAAYFAACIVVAGGAAACALALALAYLWDGGR